MARLTQKRILEILPKAGLSPEKYKTISEIAAELQVEDIHKIIRIIERLEKKKKVEYKGQKMISKEVCGINKGACWPVYGLTA